MRKPHVADALSLIQSQATPAAFLTLSQFSTNAMMMIHDPWSVSMGTAEDFRKQADLLDKIRDSIVDTYAARTKGDAAEIQALSTPQKVA